AEQPRPFPLALVSDAEHAPRPVVDGGDRQSRRRGSVPARHRVVRGLCRPGGRHVALALQRLSDGVELLLQYVAARPCLRLGGAYALLRPGPSRIRSADPRAVEARRGRAHEAAVPRGDGRRAAGCHQPSQRQARALRAVQERAEASGAAQPQDRRDFAQRAVPRPRPLQARRRGAPAGGAPDPAPQPLAPDLGPVRARALDARSRGGRGAHGDCRAPMSTPRAEGAWRAVLRHAIKFAIVFVIIFWIVRQAGWREILATIQRANPVFLLLGLLGLTLEMVSKAWNWARLLDSLGCSTRGQRLQLLRAYLVAALMGTLLPSSASTDALRIVIAQRMFGGRPSMHTACIVIQNVLGWVSACSLGLVCIGVLVAQGRAPAYALPAALVSGAVVATGLGLHLGLRRYRWLLLLMLRRLARRRWFALRRAARRFIDALLVFERANARFVPRALVA